MESTPAGWYRDPGDPALVRYWDGSVWTDRREDATLQLTVAPVQEEPTRVGPSAGRSGSPRFAVARRLVEGAKQSTVGHKLAEGTASLIDAAKDPARRDAVIVGAAPAFHAALDGAGVRNKKGKIKIWRVARAATRPRKTVQRVGTGVIGAIGAQVVHSAATSNTEHHRVAPLDEDIFAEWPVYDRSVARDRWRQGAERFESADVDDMDEMRSSALLMCDALKLCLIGDPILDDDDQIVETVGNTLTAAFYAAHESEWDQEVERIVRLALAVARRFGVQPEELGGNGELDVLFDEVNNRMRMAMSIATDRWSASLSAWFRERHPPVVATGRSS